MKNFILFCILFVLTGMLTLTACSSENDEQKEPVKEQVTENKDPEDPKETDNPEVVYMLPQTQSMNLTNEQRTLVKNNNAFAFDFYRAVNVDAMHRGKSNITSPFSLSCVLGMLNDGAKEETAGEIAALLGFSSIDKAAMNEFFKTILEQAPEVDKTVTLQMANMVAVDRIIELSDTYQQEMSSFYKATTPQLDFTAQEAADHINNWCDEKTNGMIPQVIDSENIKNAIMVLLNATYFKATWSEKFNVEDTRDEGFTGYSGESVVPMMYRKAIVRYGKNDTFSMVNLPYGGGDKWSMKILLPNKDKTVDDIINMLSVTTWETICSQMAPYTVELRLPRFKTNFDIRLNDIIAEMGAPLMFSEKADFSLMTANGMPLCVSLMKQVAAAEVNEEGTELAAITTAQMEGALDITDNTADFYANRPFVYVVEEASSGIIFFIGTYQGN